MGFSPDTHPCRDGVLNLRKAAGWTSHDVVARLRRSLGAIKVGHAGTLDPAATGVLPILIGKGTRVAEYLLDWDKEYRAVLRLGETTDTLDATGTVLERRPVEALNHEAVYAATALFTGRIRQMPPMYSAVKVQGVPLYKSARQGRIVDRAMREVTIHRLDVEKISGRDIHLRIHCSKGTYIRTLCADIGEALHVGGHLLSLERSKVGPLSVEEGIAPEDFERQLRAGMGPAAIMPLDAVLSGLPACIVDEKAARRVLNGLPVPDESVLGWERGPSDERRTYEQPVRIKDKEGRLLAIGVLQRSSGIAVRKLLVSEEPATCIS
jgi:tRNA pseudouridine55 synthase